MRESLSWTNTRIIYGDDDRFADTSWLDNMLKCSDERPEDVIVSSGMTLQNYGLMLKTKTFCLELKGQKLNMILSILQED